MNVVVDKELFKMGFFYVPKLMPEYGVIVEDRYLFFTNRNSNALVKFDIKKANIANIYYIPVSDGGAYFLFSGIYNYGNKLFLIPRCADNIVVFDTEKECFREIEGDILYDYDKIDKMGFAIPDDKFLWIISLQKKHILKLDMVQETIKEIKIDIKDCSDKFGMPRLKRGYIYITSCDERPGIKIDIDKEEVLLWEGGADLGFAYISDDFIYNINVKKGMASVQKRQLYKTDISPIYTSEPCKVGEHNTNWLYEKIEDILIIVPMYSEYILIYDINTGKIRKIDLVASGDSYIYGQKKRPNIATDVCKVDQYLYVLMSGRYEICCLNNYNQIEKIWSFDIDEKIVLKNECERQFVCERKGQELSCFQEISSLFGKERSKETKHGENIHKYILEC